MKFFTVIFLLMASVLLAQGQLETASEQETSPLMMFSFWDKKKSSERESERNHQSAQERYRCDDGDLLSGEASDNRSSMARRKDFPLGMKEDAAAAEEKGIELVSFVKQDPAEVLRHEQNLQQRKKTALNQIVLPLFILPLVVGDRVAQAGEDPKLITVFNKYRKLFLAVAEKKERQLPLAFSYQNIMIDCQRALAAGIKGIAAPAGSFERNAWNNIVTATKKLLSLKIPLIAADVAKNSKELKRLVPLVKAYESVADQRVEIIDAFKKGKTNVVQRLMANDLGEIAEKMEEYQSLRRAVRSSNRLLADEYKKIIKTYEEILNSRRESARALIQGAVYPEVGQAWLDVEKSYLLLIDWQRIAIKFIETNPTMHRYDAIDYGGSIAATHKQAVNYRIDAARAAVMGHLEEVAHCGEAAVVCEKLVGIRKSISDLDFLRLLRRFRGLSFALSKLANHQMTLHKVLSPEINGTRSWRSREASDFNKRLGAVFPSSWKKVFNSIGEEELPRQLVHDLEVTQKEVDVRTNALGLDDAERAPLLRQRLEELWMKAAACYERYNSNKSKFYAANNNSSHSEWNKKYFLKCAEYFEKEGDCYVRAIELLRTDDENSEALATRWLEIASLRNFMQIKYDEDISGCRNLPFSAWQALETVISLRTQAIEAILHGDSPAAIAALDHRAQQCEPAARAAMDEVQRVAKEKYLKRVSDEANAGIGPG